MTQRTIDMEAFGFRLSLYPALGGSILRFDRVADGEIVPVLRPCEGEPSSVLDAASFPLVPFVNRVRGGRFAFRGREVVLTPNMAPDPSPLHGQGWLGAWEVETQGDAHAVLRFDHAPGEWPWAYEARHEIALDAEGLSLTLSCRNLSDAPMPCGLGQHPYFPCTRETRIDTGVEHVWTIDEHVLPIEKVAAEGRYALADRLACGQDLDHGYGGWDGEARLTTPGVPFETVMASEDATFFQIYSPASGGFIAIEPVTHANAAMNAPEAEWAELGFRVLQPGEEMVLRSRFDVRGL